MTVPKTSVINIPLLIALLITSLVHFVVISGISIIFSEITPQKKTISITLIKLKPVTQVSAEKVQEPVAINKKITEIPVAKPAHHAVDSTNKPKSKKHRLFSQPVPKSSAPEINTVATPDIAPKKSAIEPITAENSTAPVLPIPEHIPAVAVEPVVVEPVPTPKVETPPVVPNTVVVSVSKPAEVEKTIASSDSAQPDIIGKAEDLPVNPTKKVLKKSTRKSSSHIDNAQPVLSMDDLAAQIAQVGEKFGNQAPAASESRIKPLNSVRKHKASARQYKQDWRHKIEQIANLNYPEAAREKDFSARLVMEVGINTDGSIHSLRVKKSSGTPALDEAAKNIVQMGAPFAALPKDLAEEVDVLVLQQPMQFSDESGVTIQ